MTLTRKRGFYSKFDWLGSRRPQETDERVCPTFFYFNQTMSDEYFATKQAISQPMREARISVSYRFGSMKESIRRVQRTISNDDVKSGGDSGGSTGGSVGGSGM